MAKHACKCKQGECEECPEWIFTFADLVMLMMGFFVILWVLKPAPGTEVLARFADGGAALTRRACGRGQVWVAGFFPGLEYSAAVRSEEFDMSRDFDAVRRGYVAAAALERVRPVVDAGRPLVEGVLLRNEDGRRAVVLMNWAYRVSGRRVSGGRASTVKSLAPFKDLRVMVRGAGEVTRAASTALGRALTVERAGDGVTVLLPVLDEGDVLRLE